MATTRRSLLTGAAALAGLSVLQHRTNAAKAKRSSLFTPEMFGAMGDGVTDDSAAMAALASAVNQNGGGTVKFRRTTYKVGAQVRAAQDDAFYLFEPAKLLEFSGCRNALKIVGNGARLKCAEGLRYGVFAADGTPARHAAPYLGPGLATPYSYMIRIADCTGAVEVSDLEIDGSNTNLVIGGTYGDTGWQIPAIGLALFNNHGAEIVRNVYTHHHGEDGFYIDGIASAGGQRRGARSRASAPNITAAKAAASSADAAIASSAVASTTQARRASPASRVLGWISKPKGGKPIATCASPTANSPTITAAAWSPTQATAPM